MVAEIRFPGQEYEGVAEQLGGFTDTLNNMVNDHAVSEFGEEAHQDPAAIEITPVVIEGEPSFVVRAWHEEGEGEEQEIVQPHDLSFKVVLEGDEAVARTEDEEDYSITTRETLLLRKLANIAFEKSSVQSDETPEEEDR